MYISYTISNNYKYISYNISMSICMHDVLEKVLKPIKQFQIYAVKDYLIQS